MPDTPNAEVPAGTAETAPDAEPADDKRELRESFREALARKTAKNSHVESHLDGHSIGGHSNDTRKRQFRRKSG